MIGGSIGNMVIVGTGATIGGGGRIMSPNVALGGYAVVAGGFGNRAVDFAAVSGGTSNLATGIFSVVGGGSWNVAASEAVVSGGVSNLATAVYSTISGGSLNRATNSLAAVSGGGYNLAGGYASVVAGGGGLDQFLNPLSNLALGNWSAIGGGQLNIASGDSATVAGGNFNRASGIQSTVGGGTGHHSDADYTTVGGGFYNTADAHAATVSGGEENGADNMDATVGGGVGNYSTGLSATIGGGANNLAQGDYSTVPGGRQADPTQYGQLSHAAGNFQNPGDAQHSIFVLRALTVPGGAADLALDGGATRLKITANRTFTFHILVAARATPPDTSSAGFEITGVVKDSSGLAAFVGTPTITTLGQDFPCTVTLTTSADAMVLTANNLYINPVRWVARVDAADVAW